MIDGTNIFYRTEKNDLITQENIQKIETGQRDDNTTGCLLDYNYFRNYKIITIDIGKQQELNAHAKPKQKNNFNESLD